MPDEIDELFQRMRDRAEELQANGLDWQEAHGIAWLEERVSRWPVDWGNNLRFLVYGDFSPPEKEIAVPVLGIMVGKDKQENTVIQGPRCVLDASIRVETRSVDAIVDAMSRINLFLGTQALVSWNNARAGWWSWITHEGGGGVMGNLKDEYVEGVIERVRSLAPNARRHVEAALYWIRQPHTSVLQAYRYDPLAAYASLWNAFECLVEAVNVLKPPARLSKVQKQRLIAQYVGALNGAPLTAADIVHLYKNVIDTRFVGKAKHAMSTCFGAGAQHYIHECFTRTDTGQRLYEVRNAINHGSASAHDPQELIRIDAAHRRLWIIVWGMFGRLVPFPAPVDTELGRSSD